MPNRALSPREEEIIELSVDGLTNDAIAHRLGISVGTVNTYWLRIKMKVGGLGRTDTVVKVVTARAERALRESNTERTSIVELIAEKAHSAMELKTALALLNLAMEQIKSTVWACDRDLSIQVMANGQFPSTHFGVTWEVGKTIYEIFKTEDPKDLAVAAHLAALDGKETEVRLVGEFENMFLRVVPLADEASVSMGCISVLNTVTPSTDH